MSPIGVVGALGVLGARVAGVSRAFSPSAARCGVAFRSATGWPVSISSSDVEMAASSDMGPRQSQQFQLSLTIVLHEVHNRAPNFGASLRDHGFQSST